MPLPDAPPPRSSRVYQQTTGKTLQSLTVQNLDTISDPVFLDRNSEDELRRINLVGQASNLQSQSGPIPGTGEVKEVLDTTGSGTPISTLLEPGAGEAYEITAANWETKNSNAAYWRIQDPNTSGTGVLVEYKTAQGTLDITTTPIRIVYPQKFVVYYGSATGDNQTNLAFHRIR